MDDFKKYRRTAIKEMRPFVPGENTNGMCVNIEDDPETDLGMVERNPANGELWYIPRAYFEANFEPVDS